MGRDEQREEREVLDSIFPDEITDISETEYRVSISLDVVGDDSREDPDAEPPTLLLRVTYPEDYPDAAPILDITEPLAEGGTTSNRYAHLDVSEDKARLLDSLQPAIEENLGMAMVFALVSALKDGAELLITERQAAVRTLREAEMARAEEEDNKRFHGSMVNRETFLEWRDTFQREMEEQARTKELEREAEEKKKRGPKEEKKMTGKELWEKGLVGKLEDEEEEAGEDQGVDGVAAMEKLRVEA